MRPALVIGCGYLGEALTAMLRAEGREICVTRRSAPALAAVADRLGAVSLVFDTAAGNAPLPCWPVPLPASLDVFCLLTPSALAAPAARARLSAWLERLPLARGVLSSSTGIYSEEGDVSAETPVAPVTARARLLADIEAWWMHDPRCGVVRLAGLYGPHRVIGARGLREGAPLAGRPDAWLNLIHRDDAADLLRHCLVPLAGGRIEVGSDGRPLRRGEYYRELAARLAASAPRFAPAAADTSPGKRVDPRSTWQRRDWRPRYPDCMLGVAQALRAEQAN